MGSDHFFDRIKAYTPPRDRGGIPFMRPVLRKRCTRGTPPGPRCVRTVAPCGDQALPRSLFLAILRSARGWDCDPGASWILAVICCEASSFSLADTSASLPAS